MSKYNDARIRTVRWQDGKPPQHEFAAIGSRATRVKFEFSSRDPEADSAVVVSRGETALHLRPSEALELAHLLLDWMSEESPNGNG